LGPWLWLWLVAAAGPSALSAQEPGLTAAGLAGIERIHLPRSRAPSVAVAASAGYGLTESLGGTPGAHHRAAGVLGVGAAVLDGLGFGLRLDGRHDVHPDDGMGIDSGTVGDPRLLARGGLALNDALQLGAELMLWLPGESAPSLALDASSVDARLVLAHAAPHDAWTLAATAGYRFDQSASAAPQLDRLRAGDRVALGLSDFDAVLVGLGALYRHGALELAFEAGLDLLVGSDAPGLGKSPIRITGGARYHASAALQLAASLAVSPSARPTQDAGDPLVPIEPRLALQVGFRYAFGPRPASEPADTESAAPPVPVAAPPAAVAVTGRLLDDEGAPVTGARVSLRAGALALETDSDDQGGYRFDDVAPGPAELEATRDGYEPLNFRADIAADSAALPDQVLVRIALGQLRGQALSFRGRPIKALIRVVSLDADDAPPHELTAGADGRFTIELPPGRYQVQVSARGYAPQEREVEVTADGVMILNLDLHRAKR
jgi:hypothetical protein